MGNVLRLIVQSNLRVPTLPCITQPQASTWGRTNVQKCRPRSHINTLEISSHLLSVAHS
jgi:hypothetical protein